MVPMTSECSTSRSALRNGHSLAISAPMAPRRMERDLAGAVAPEYAVEHQGMDVHIEVQGPAEPGAPRRGLCAVGWESLDHRDRAAAGLLEARGTRVLPQQTKHGADETRRPPGDTDRGPTPADISPGAVGSAPTPPHRAKNARWGPGTVGPARREVRDPRDARPAPTRRRQGSGEARRSASREGGIRRPSKLGQSPRLLHENAARRFRARLPQRDHANPPARNPHWRKSRSARPTRGRRPSPSRNRAAGPRRSRGGPARSCGGRFRQDCGVHRLWTGGPYRPQSASRTARIPRRHSAQTHLLPDRISTFLRRERRTTLADWAITRPCCCIATLRPNRMATEFGDCLRHSTPGEYRIHRRSSDRCLRSGSSGSTHRNIANVYSNRASVAVVIDLSSMAPGRWPSPSGRTTARTESDASSTCGSTSCGAASGIACR
jgi:hypothetical protein